MAEDKPTKERISLDSVPVDPSSIRVDEKGWLHFKSLGITQDQIPADWLDYAGKDSVNKHFIYRHRHPQNPKHKDEPYYGRVESFEVVKLPDGRQALVNGFLVKNTVRRQIELQKLILRHQSEKRPFGVSYQYDMYKAHGKVVDLDMVEISATPSPAVKEALVFEEGFGDDPMPGEKTEADKAETDKIQKQLDEKEIPALEGLEKSLEDKNHEVELL